MRLAAGGSELPEPLCPGRGLLDGWHQGAQEAAGDSSQTGTVGLLQDLAGQEESGLEPRGAHQLWTAVKSERHVEDSDI